MPKKNKGEAIKLCEGKHGDCLWVWPEFRSRALPVITFPHAKIHHGASYFMNVAQAININEVVEFHLEVPEGVKPHVLFEIDATGATHVQLFEGTEKTPGDLIPSFNRDRNSTNESSLVFSSVPNGENGEGSIIWEGLFGLRRFTSQSDFDQELILKEGTSYLGRITAKTSGNLVNVSVSWYEETDWDEEEEEDE